MTARLATLCVAAVAGASVFARAAIGVGAASGKPAAPPQFQTSDRCIACHNGLLTATGQDVSIAVDWRASMMANSSRDPYWQASVRRESMDHVETTAAIQDECSICHMPIARANAQSRGHTAALFAHLPFAADRTEGRQAADGVSCSVCHQIGKARLGTRESFNGGFVVDTPADPAARPEYGPYEVDQGHTRIMLSSSEGYRPTASDHIRQS